MILLLKATTERSSGKQRLRASNHAFAATSPGQRTFASQTRTVD